MNFMTNFWNDSNKRVGEVVQKCVSMKGRQVYIKGCPVYRLHTNDRLVYVFCQKGKYTITGDVSGVKWRRV